MQIEVDSAFFRVISKTVAPWLPASTCTRRLPQPPSLVRKMSASSARGPRFTSRPSYTSDVILSILAANPKNAGHSRSQCYDWLARCHCTVTRRSSSWCTRHHGPGTAFPREKPPRWPSGKGVRLGSGRSGVRIPLARFFPGRVIPVTSKLAL